MGSLTAQQEKFAWLVAQLHTGAEAYRRAYNCKDGTPWARQEASRLLADPAIAATVAELKADLKARHKSVLDALVNFHFGVLTFDPTEIAHYRRGACQHCYGDDHQKQWRLPDYVEAVRTAERTGKPLPDIAGGFGYDMTKEPVDDCPKCDGAGVGYQWIADSRKLSEAAKAGFISVKESRNSVEVTVADKQKAADALSALFGLSKATINLNTTAVDAAVKFAPGVDPNDAARTYSDMIGNC